MGTGDAAVLGRFALYCAHTGRTADAEAAMRPALDLDPLNALMHRAMGTVLYEARRFADAIAAVDHALVLNPQLSNAHAAIGNALLMLGRTRDAADAFRREPADLYRLTGLAIVERKLGNDANAVDALARIRNDLGDRSLYQQAQLQAQSSAPGAAMQALDRALTLGASGLIYLRTDPLLDPLRELPGFTELLRKLGFD
jgi:tetratricopeptide (TPR) repeat protein